MKAFRSRTVGDVNASRVMFFVDVSRAHFHPGAARKLFIKLPPEDSGGEGLVGEFPRCMYGTRDSAHRWDRSANAEMEKLGYTVGISAPCIYKHETENSPARRHRDDIILEGKEDFVVGVFTKLQAAPMII